LLDRTLRMNARLRINGLLADWTAFPIEINDRGVAVLGEYHGHLVCEHADGRFFELAQRSCILAGSGQKSKTRGFSGYSVEIRSKVTG
jgi:hypothetical protein